VNFEK
jgi:hypothetical protein